MQDKWNAYYGETKRGEGFSYIAVEGGPQVAECHGGNHKDNALLIARAHNVHAELVAVAQQSLGVLLETRNPNDNILTTIANLENAIDRVAE